MHLKFFFLTKSYSITIVETILLIKIALAFNYSFWTFSNFFWRISFLVYCRWNYLSSLFFHFVDCFTKFESLTKHFWILLNNLLQIASMWKIRLKSHNPFLKSLNDRFSKIEDTLSKIEAVHTSIEYQKLSKFYTDHYIFITMGNERWRIASLQDI